MSGVITRIKLLNMGGTAEFGWGPEDPVDERQLEVGGSGGHGIFRWEPLAQSCPQSPEMLFAVFLKLKLCETQVLPSFLPFPPPSCSLVSVT